MALSRLKKSVAPLSIPYLWNAAHPPPVRASAVTVESPQTTAHSEREREEIFRQGYIEGESAGRSAQADEAVRKLGETVSNLSATRISLFRSAQKDVLRLAIAVSQRILHREILMSPEVLGGLIAVALNRLEEQDVHTLRVHPSIAARIETLLANHDMGRKIGVLADSSLELGGCIFVTNHGTVDAGIESQLSEIERGLADHLEAL